jgi:hypothetical protein
MKLIVPIVEGYGEVHSVPVLLHRIAVDIGHDGLVTINPPLRIKAGQLTTNDDALRKFLGVAAHKAKEARGLVLLLLDCDDGCPAEVGPDLLRRSQALRPDVRLLVALAHREFESWFLAAAPSLSGRAGLPDRLEAPDDPEAIRDAKGWIDLQLRQLGGYKVRTHQTALTREMDLRLARRSRSFGRLYDRISSFLRE